MESAARTPTILVVDDDEGLIGLIESALRRENWNVATAGSGAAGLAWLRNNSADLLLLDLKLSDIEGKEFIAALADVGRPIPFIIITGQGDERVAVDMMKRGALDYLVKTINFLEFVPVVVRGALETLEKEKRLALAEKQARLSETVVEQSYTAVLITSVEMPDPEINYVNPAFAQLTGFAAEKLIGRRLSEVETFGKRCPQLQRVLVAGRPWIGELTLHGANGARRIVQGGLIPVLDPQGRQIHWAANLHDITERTRLEEEVLAVTDREQQRIAHELHDSLGQLHTVLEIHCFLLLKNLASEDLTASREQLQESARQMSRALRECVTATRSLAHGLVPVKLNADGLSGALRQLAHRASVPGKVECRFTRRAPVTLLNAQTASHLYRIAQEAVNNALKHARMRRIHITLTRDSGSLRLQIKDDGRGLPTRRKSKSGMGLDIMCHRAHVIGASLEIDSKPGQGVSVTCILPLIAGKETGSSDGRGGRGYGREERVPARDQHSRLRDDALSRRH